MNNKSLFPAEKTVSARLAAPMTPLKQSEISRVADKYLWFVEAHAQADH